MTLYLLPNGDCGNTRAYRGFLGWFFACDCGTDLGPRPLDQAMNRIMEEHIERAEKNKWKDTDDG